MISIIVPVYNSAQYIERCINSIQLQTISDWELLLINDGSTDNSVSLIEPYLFDSRIQLFSKENGGVSSARNLGIKKSKGEYILFLDSDDWLSKNTCEVLLDVKDCKGADCVIFGFNQSHGAIWAPEYNKDYISVNALKKEFDYWLNTELLSSSVNKLYKKELINDLFPENMTFGEDLVFSLKYLNNCEKISLISVPLYQHEVYNESSLTHTFNVSRFIDIEIVQRNILDFALEKNDINIYSKYVRDCVRLVRACLRDDNIDYAKKKLVLREWLCHSHFKLVNTSYYPMDWRNRLMMFFLIHKMFFMSFFVANVKRVLLRR